jgi:hypothetical protein
MTKIVVEADMGVPVSVEEVVVTGTVTTTTKLGRVEPGKGRRFKFSGTIVVTELPKGQEPLYSIGVLPPRPT